MGTPLVMGRATFDSIGRPLPGRTTSCDPRPRLVRRRRARRALPRQAARDRRRAARRRRTSSGALRSTSRRCRWPPHQVLTEVHLAPDGDAHYPEFDRDRLGRDPPRGPHRPRPGVRDQVAGAGVTETESDPEARRSPPWVGPGVAVQHDSGARACRVVGRTRAGGRASGRPRVTRAPCRSPPPGASATSCSTCSPPGRPDFRSSISTTSTSWPRTPGSSMRCAPRPTGPPTHRRCALLVRRVLPRGGRALGRRRPVRDGTAPGGALEAGHALVPLRRHAGAARRGHGLLQGLFTPLPRRARAHPGRRPASCDLVPSVLATDRHRGWLLHGRAAPPARPTPCAAATVLARDPGGWPGTSTSSLRPGLRTVVAAATLRAFEAVVETGHRDPQPDCRRAR